VSQQAEKFVKNNRTHVLMITNHGVHEWKVIPGMPDTGGQNVYVNQFTDALIDQGYRVTITNRGGYKHPKTGEVQTGTVYHESGFGRIVYLEDSTKEFVRKEDMDAQLPELADDLIAKLNAEDDDFDLIISHYWDAGKLGNLVNGRIRGHTVPHVWIPHSLGALKKRNMEPATWDDLRIDERIANEHELIKHTTQVVATSSAIRETFINDYEVKPETIQFLPPCIEVDRIYPKEPADFEPIYGFLAELSPHSADDLKQRPLVMEVSRTDGTKRKDVLIRAFADVKRQVPDAVLMVSIDPLAKALYGELMGLIEELGVKDDVIVLGSVYDKLPDLYNAATVFCTPSVMEGFGMTAQEAAATATPVVSSDLVPFVVEYLLGEGCAEEACGSQMLRMGEGGIVVPADFEEGFAHALHLLLTDPERCERLGRRAREITIPYFTWKVRTEDLLGDLGITAERG
jgi:glycosyltransferase involved in cell wall biosynthesis